MSCAAVRTTRGGPASDVARARITRDLLLLAELFDHEPDRESIIALWARCYDGLLESAPYGPVLRDAVNRFCDSLTEIPTCFDTHAGDALRADFRRICTTDENHDGTYPPVSCRPGAQNLQVESAAFRQWAAVRGIVARSGNLADGYGVVVGLRYLARLVAADGVAAPAGNLQQYMEQHLLRNVDGFVAKVAAHSDTRLFQALGILTAAYVHELEQRFASGVLERNPSETPRKAKVKPNAPDPRGYF